MKDNWFQRYVLPGFIFQSAVIGGAYGSGKELQEFFLGHGPVGGLLGMAVTMVVFSVVLMAAYEFARKFRLFDYRSFCKALLGRAWPLYEILYVLMMILVISVVGAAAGDILKDTFGLPAFVGTAAIMVLTALLVFYGTPAVERFLALWSFVLYGTYLSFFVWHLVQNGADIAANLSAENRRGLGQKRHRFLRLQHGGDSGDPVLHSTPTSSTRSSHCRSLGGANCNGACHALFRCDDRPVRSTRCSRR